MNLQMNAFTLHYNNECILLCVSYYVSREKTSLVLPLPVPPLLPPSAHASLLLILPPQPRAKVGGAEHIRGYPRGDQRTLLRPVDVV